MKSVVVFCGSRHGAKPEYTEAARTLGRLLAERQIALVYGGGNVGLMGEVAHASLDAGGRVVGVIPEFMAERELALAACSELLIVDSMHTRKARMAELADGFIAMPGGFGTFDELFEILTWAQIGLHGKPVGILNTVGYYDALLGFMRQTVNEGFVHAKENDRIVVGAEPADLLDRLAATPVLPARWGKADLLKKS
ncbi:putative cytokinin riboside 5'-monophosphate phosphoribohydrolase [Jeongeupia sp. HS-3]|uniref:LOG family protein n=1 Tax=Jeongeupia sp. HS-3 TaxID=1009682 RepID=UPI0018A3A444|nr:TIGR00730 family Rossman fold protein [Jeongeupia sp. HS-3]BCL74935.1 putative cytokinin riboside 5'-monophosphate phosphoribohydrolase [Jeongeupia sp. HS-3]